MLPLITLLIVSPQSGDCESTLDLPSRTVVIKLPYVNATIPCSYTSPDDVTTTTWTRGGVNGPTVLQRSSSGTVEPGLGYDGLVSFGEGCSLVFKSPGLKDDGNFTITIYNQEDSSETVRLIVVGENATVYSSGRVHAAIVLPPLEHHAEDIRHDTPPSHIILTPDPPAPFPGSNLSALSVKQGGSKYHFYSLWYDRPRMLDLPNSRLYPGHQVGPSVLCKMT